MYQKFNKYEVSIDFLRLVLNKARLFSLIILVNGHGQVGKSTWIQYVANRIKQIQLGIPLKKATWREWDYKKFTSTTPKQFVQLWNENENEVLALEEAGNQLDYTQWYSTMAQVFNQTSNTQGLKHNICFLITPHAVDIVKRQRELVDFKVWVKRRIDAAKLTIVRPRYIKIDYLKDKTRLGYIADWYVKYPTDFLKISREFTNWLKKYKLVIMHELYEQVGLFNPNKPISDKNKPDWVKEIMRDMGI